jgi:hypothetical protein
VGHAREKTWVIPVRSDIKDLIGSGYKAKSIASGEADFAASKLGMQIPRVETA